MYKIPYTYDNPHGAGPFKGRTVSDVKYSKGDIIWAVFGCATVVSCRLAAKAGDS